MNRSPIAVVLALAALGANGCGTIWNLSRGADMQPYGGVRRIFDHKGTASTTDKTSPCVEFAVLVFLGPILIIAATEGCLTSVGDTLTLPLTCWVKEHQSRKAAAGNVGDGSVTPPTMADTSSSPSPDLSSSSSEPTANSQGGDSTRLPQSSKVVAPASFGPVRALSEGR